MDIKKNMRVPTTDEKTLVASSLNNIKILAKENAIGYNIQTIFGAVMMFVIVAASFKIVPMWFTIVLSILVIACVASLTYDAMKRNAITKTAIEAMENGTYLVTTGSAKDCYCSRYNCVVSGKSNEIDNIDIDFSISAQFVEDKDFDSHFKK